jgi:hypothetical protein
MDAEELEKMRRVKRITFEIDYAVEHLAAADNFLMQISHRVIDKHHYFGNSINTRFFISKLRTCERLDCLTIFLLQSTQLLRNGEIMDLFIDMLRATKCNLELNDMGHIENCSRDPMIIPLIDFTYA